MNTEFSIFLPMYEAAIKVTPLPGDIAPHPIDEIQAMGENLMALAQDLKPVRDAGWQCDSMLDDGDVQIQFFKQFPNAAAAASEITLLLPTRVESIGYFYFDGEDIELDVA